MTEAEAGDRGRWSPILEELAEAQTAADIRKLFSLLMTDQKLAQFSDDPAVVKARGKLKLLTSPAGAPSERLAAVSEIVRLAQTYPRWKKSLRDDLTEAFQTPLMAFDAMPVAEDRLYVAKACDLFRDPWIRDYLVASIVADSAPKVRTQACLSLFSYYRTLGEILRAFSDRFATNIPQTDTPADTQAKRATNLLSSLRSALADIEIDPGDDFGVVLGNFLKASAEVAGAPTAAEAQINLTKETCLILQQAVRTRFSLAATPSTYSPVRQCRRFWPRSSWPKELKAPLEALTKILSEALLLLAKQGQRDQDLLEQLDVLCNFRERAQSIRKELAAAHPELSEELRYWLTTGQVRIGQTSSNSVQESTLSSVDTAVALALLASHEMQVGQESLNEQLVSNLEVFVPSLLPSTRVHFLSAQRLSAQVLQLAALRRLEIFGRAGDIVAVQPKYFDVVSERHTAQMRVVQPAVVRGVGPDGIGEVIVKGILE